VFIELDENKHRAVEVNIKFVVILSQVFLRMAWEVDGVICHILFEDIVNKGKIQKNLKVLYEKRKIFFSETRF
jgi:hypothetical protein